MAEIELTDLVPRALEATDTAIVLDDSDVTQRAILPTSFTVLKGWTSTTTLDNELTSGVDFGVTGLKDVTIELKNLVYSGGASGSPANNLIIRAYLAGKVAPTTNASRGSIRFAESNELALQNDFFQVMGSSFAISSGRWTIDLDQDTPSGNVGLRLEGFYLPGTWTGLVGAVDLNNIMSFREAGNPPSEIWVTGQIGETIAYDYRILRKS